MTSAAEARKEVSGAPLTDAELQRHKQRILHSRSLEAATQAALGPSYQSSLPAAARQLHPEGGGGDAAREQPTHQRQLTHEKSPAGLAAEIAAAAAAGAGWMGPTTRPTGVYYHRELLARSTQGRRIDLLTISGTNSMGWKREERLAPPLLPEASERPYRFNR